MSKNSKWNRPQQFNVNDLWKDQKSRQRPRSTVFDDGMTRNEMRQKRRQNEKKEINDAIEEDLEIIFEFDDEFYFED